MNQISETKRARGIYFFPNLLTLLALFSSFYSIVMGMNARYTLAAMGVFVAMFLDALDGRLARLTNTTTEFGAQLDSLCDMVGFGLAPALLLYTWSLHVLGKTGWLAAFIYAVCTGLRLARFNTQLGIVNKRYFQGLNTPSAAGVVAGMVWFCDKYDILGVAVAFPVLFITLILSLLKVSTVRYRSFKDLDIRGKVPFFFIIIMAMLIVLISYNAPLILFILFLTYTVSGPLITVWGIRQKRYRKRHRHQKHDDQEKS
jgi:CDP-diacylglycerol--serine O-phosphatidyltransferase